MRLQIWYHEHAMTESPFGDYIFEIVDWRGRPVRLTRRTFENHKDRHPEVPLYIEQAKLTIEDPDFVGEEDYGAVCLFRFGLGRGVFANLYLRVIIYYRGRPERGVVATYHFTDSIGEDITIIEHRYQWLAGARHDVRGVGGAPC